MRLSLFLVLCLSLTACDRRVVSFEPDDDDTSNDDDASGDDDDDATDDDDTDEIGRAHV